MVPGLYCAAYTGGRAPIKYLCARERDRESEREWWGSPRDWNCLADEKVKSRCDVRLSLERLAQKEVPSKGDG